MDGSTQQEFVWPILSDRYSDEDQLGFKDYCDVLAQAVQQADTPISIGILGDWGSGKTSLMRMLENRLKEDDHCITVWFDAWKFTKEEVLWRAFLLRVISDLRNALEGKGKLDSESKEQFDRWEKRIYEALDLEQMGELTLDWKKAASGATALVSSVIPFGSVLSGVVDKLTGAKATSQAAQQLIKGDLNAVKDLADLVHKEKIEIHQRQLKFMEDFQTEFEAITKAYRKDDEQARIVVFVDDLDRCLPEKAMQILEAIKLFLEVEGTVFVLGVAQEVVQRGIEVWYKIEPPKDGESSPFSGKKYLEKIIQLPFRLPALEPERFIGFIEKNCENMPEFCAEIFGCGLEPNPRKAKRLINVFGLQLALGQKRIGEDLKPWLLAKLNVIQERWPRLYTYLVTWPAEISTLEQACLESSYKNPSEDSEPMPEAVEKELSQRVYAPDIVEHAQNHGLQEMMCCKAKECSTQNIKLSILKKHIHLTETIATAPSKSVKDLEDMSLWQQLTSDTPEEQNEALEKIKELPDSEKKPLLSYIKNELDTKRLFELLPLSRAGAFKGLALLGDPRRDVLDSGSMAFRCIKKGPFWYGEGKEAKECHELSYEYWLAKYPVTVSQFRQFADSKEYQQDRYWPEAIKDGFQRKGMPELPNRFAYASHPVVNVSWYESLAYCRWLKDQSKLMEGGNQAVAALVREDWHFCLPLEIEWEKAARGPSPGKRLYPCGDAIASNAVNYSETGLSSTSSVGCFPDDESPFHCIDMTGNVFEWCRRKPGDDSSSRVFRGGSWGSPAEDCRCSYRDGIVPDFRYDDLGFRVALVPSSVG
ncbi:MAG: SUMF1/EgtB/PvdO family nonheme iron enzyme [Phycisphaeraceae bacterium]|nr:SUMF1/EgtB/PvdO family nonheme iron enzyme [Phycisphaeraceae bacterium]